jgi:DNA-binding PadR family transcriptional regulator
MPIHHAVLALLDDGPSYGYELKASFEEAVGPQWGPLNIGHLYQILARLDRDGLVVRTPAQAPAGRARPSTGSAASPGPQPARPERVVYEITAAGRAELQDWLGRPAERAGGFRDDLFLKILAAERSPHADALARLLSTQRAHLLGELRDLAELRRQRGDQRIVRLLVVAAELQVRAQLQFVDVVEDELPTPAPARDRRSERAAAPRRRADRPPSSPASAS